MGNVESDGLFFKCTSRNIAGLQIVWKMSKSLTQAKTFTYSAVMQAVYGMFAKAHGLRSTILDFTRPAPFAEPDALQSLQHIYECVFPPWLRAFDEGNRSDADLTDHRGITVAEAMLSDVKFAVSPPEHLEFQRGQFILVMHHWNMILIHGIGEFYTFVGEDFFEQGMGFLWLSSRHAATCFESCARVANLMHACRRAQLDGQRYDEHSRQRNLWICPTIASALFHIGHTLLVALRAAALGILPATLSHLNANIILTYLYDYLWGLDQIAMRWSHAMILRQHLYGMMSIGYDGRQEYPLSPSKRQQVQDRKRVLVQGLHGAIIASRETSGEKN